MKLDANKTGLTLGCLMAIWHISWSLLVLLGFAQSVLDFVFSIHFLVNPYTVQAYNLMTSLVLIAITFVVGYVLGYVFSFIWNKMNK